MTTIDNSADNNSTFLLVKQYVSIINDTAKANQFVQSPSNNPNVIGRTY